MEQLQIKVYIPVLNYIVYKYILFNEVTAQGESLRIIHNFDTDIKHILLIALDFQSV